MFLSVGKQYHNSQTCHVIIKCVCVLSVQDVMYTCAGARSRNCYLVYECIVGSLHVCDSRSVIDAPGSSCGTAMKLQKAEVVVSA